MIKWKDQKEEEEGKKSSCCLLFVFVCCCFALHASQSVGVFVVGFKGSLKGTDFVPGNRIAVPSSSCLLHFKPPLVF